MSYQGVYSPIGAGTNVGTKLEVEQGFVLAKTSSRQDRHVVTTEELLDSDLNVAKIRLVTTLPNNKLLDNDLENTAYVGFILTGVQESHQEKLELVPLPGDSFASYFYGANPRQFNFNGMLLNTEQDQWRDSFEELYEKHLRGSVSARNFSIVQVSYNGRVVSGWLTNLSQQLDSSNDHYSMFSFSVLVSRIDMVGGTKNFKEYLVKVTDSDDLAKANLDLEYEVLDPTNFNAMVDPVRTGLAIPPKRPHKRRAKKSTTPDCMIVPTRTSSGKATNSGSSTVSTHINDASKCSALSKVKNVVNYIGEKDKEIADLKADGTNLDELRKKQLERTQAITDLQRNLEENKQFVEDIKSELSSRGVKTDAGKSFGIGTKSSDFKASIKISSSGLKLENITNTEDEKTDLIAGKRGKEIAEKVIKAEEALKKKLKEEKDQQKKDLARKQNDPDSITLTQDRTE